MMNVRLGAVENLDGKPAPPPASRTESGAIVPLPGNTLRVSDAQTWAVGLPPQYAIEDALDPGLWKRIEFQSRGRSVKPTVGDYVRVIGANRSFDCLFTVEAVISGGYELRYHSGRLPEHADEALLRILRRQHHVETA